MSVPGYLIFLRQSQVMISAKLPLSIKIVLTRVVITFNSPPWGVMRGDKATTLNVTEGYDRDFYKISPFSGHYLLCPMHLRLPHSVRDALSVHSSYSSYYFSRAFLLLKAFLRFNLAIVEGVWSWVQEMIFLFFILQAHGGPF